MPRLKSNRNKTTEQPRFHCYFRFSLFPKMFSLLPLHSQDMGPARVNSSSVESTMHQNSIGAPKIQNNDDAIKFILFPNIAIAISNFSLLLLAKLLLLIFLIFGISFLLLFLIAVSKVIALLIMAIVVAQLLFAITVRAKTICIAIQNRSYKPRYKTYTKMWD